jgi:hypothetical protein
MGTIFIAMAGSSVRPQPNIFETLCWERGTEVTFARQCVEQETDVVDVVCCVLKGGRGKGATHPLRMVSCVPRELSRWQCVELEKFSPNPVWASEILCSVMASRSERSLWSLAYCSGRELMSTKEKYDESRACCLPGPSRHVREATSASWRSRTLATGTEYSWNKALWSICRRKIPSGRMPT